MSTSAQDLTSASTILDMEVPNQSTKVITSSTPSKKQRSALELKGLRFAPPEVREIIFANSFEEHNYIHDTELHTLLSLFKALEGDQELYDEAQEVYFKVTVFRASWQHDKPEEVEDVLPYEKIQKLEIRFHYFQFEHDQGKPRARTDPFETVRKLLSQATNVTDLALFFPSPMVDGMDIFDVDCETDARVFEKISMCLGSFKKLRNFAVEITKYWFERGNGYAFDDGDYGVDDDDVYSDDYDGDYGDDDGYGSDASHGYGEDEEGGERLGFADAGGGDEDEAGEDRVEGNVTDEDGLGEDELETNDFHHEEGSILWPDSITAIDQGLGLTGERPAERVSDACEATFKSVWKARAGEVLVWNPEAIQVEF